MENAPLIGMAIFCWLLGFWCGITFRWRRDKQSGDDITINSGALVKLWRNR